MVVLTMGVGCVVKRNQNGNLALRLFFSGLRSWEGIRGLKDTSENRDFLEAKAKVIRREIHDGTFDYLRWFPDGNLSHLFRQGKVPPLLLSPSNSFTKSGLRSRATAYGRIGLRTTYHSSTGTSCQRGLAIKDSGIWRLRC